MFKLLKSLSAGYEGYMIQVGRKHARDVLMSQSDRILEDMGISRGMLVQGVDSWPWRENAEQPMPTRYATRSHKRMEAKAIRELKAMSDMELNDIGITRGTIVQAVRYGTDRPRKDTVSSVVGATIINGNANPQLALDGASNASDLSDTRPPENPIGKPVAA